MANMSHELRTPLNHIIGFTEILLGKHFGDLNDVQNEYLNDVLQSSKHLLALISDILDLAKIEAGRMQLASSKINLKVLLEKSLKVIEASARQRGIQLIMGIDSISTSIKADELKLKQIIFNLLSNAVKFTPDGGKVRLSAQMLSGCVIRPGRRWKDPQSLRIVEEPVAKNPDKANDLRKCVQISVSDTGIGINPQDQARIFDRFEQIKGSMNGSRQGAGLGLTLTKTLVEMHGGKIWVDSEGQGKGSRFNFVIPV
jgi:signal transduction histidine kinase